MTSQFVPSTFVTSAFVPPAFVPPALMSSAYVPSAFVTPAYVPSTLVAPPSVYASSVYAAFVHAAPVHAAFVSTAEDKPPSPAEIKKFLDDLQAQGPRALQGLEADVKWYLQWLSVSRPDPATHTGAAHAVAAQHECARITREAFPFLREYLTRMVADLLDSERREDWHRVPDMEWAYTIAAFVQALAVEPDDALAGELAAWLESHYYWGLEWVPPPYVHPRRQRAVAALEAKALTARLRAEEMDLLSGLRKAKVAEAWRLMHEDPPVLSEQGIVSQEFLREVIALWDKYGARFSPCRQYSLFGTFANAPENEGVWRATSIDRYVVADPAMTASERDCLRRMEPLLSARLHMARGDESQMD